MLLKAFSLVLVMSTCVSSQSDAKVIHIDQGPVRGYKSTIGDFYTFYGIPYATTPTGRDKFKAPLPPPSWTSVFEATDSQIMCPQPWLSVGMTQEDCLVVNVYSPTVKNVPLSVIVYIHGGAFIGGYGTVISPEYLMEHNVVMVSFNYRLGATGFLCMRNENIPGNAGYKDQVAALRWVQRNIASFGGDPNDVTIAGFSAGSMSVETLMTSPMAKGLFHKVISESGSALTPPSSSADPTAFAKRFVSDIIGRDIENLEEVEHFLLNATSFQLITELYGEYQQQTDFNMGFTLCIEKEIDGVENFMTETPLDILVRGTYNKVPYMTGIASEEGTLFLSKFHEWKNRMEEDFVDFLPVYLNFHNENEKIVIAERIKHFYFNNGPVSTRGYVDFVSDVLFGYPMFRAVRYHVQNSVPVYLYYFSYIASGAIPYDDNFVGAGHSAQSSFVNRMAYDALYENESDILMRDRLTKMWADFAKHGKPMSTTSELLPVMWEQLDLNRMNYLAMDEELSKREHLLKDRFQLWDDIIQQLYTEYL